MRLSRAQVDGFGEIVMSRLSAGAEDVADLVEDLGQALAAC